LEFIVAVIIIQTKAINNVSRIAPNVNWPKSRFFVHVDEQGVLSSALTEHLNKYTQVGVAHAGWQGILNGVIESFIKAFDEHDLLIHFLYN
jgi:hypothetical protein